jgi:hypothetical protein
MRCEHIVDISDGPCGECEGGSCDLISDERYRTPKGTKMDKTSPRPWSVDAMGYIRGSDNSNVLEVQENAKLVCRAVNAHEDILKALTEIEGYLASQDIPYRDHALRIVRNASAKAEGI